MAYKLSISSELDILGIYGDGHTEFGAAQAESYYATLEKTFGLLADFPRLAHERPEFTPPVRIHPCGVHVIIYIVDDQNDILIVRVRHGREDWMNHPAGQ